MAWYSGQRQDRLRSRRQSIPDGRTHYAPGLALLTVLWDREAEGCGLLGTSHFVRSDIETGHDFASHVTDGIFSVVPPFARYLVGLPGLAARW